MEFISTPHNKSEKGNVLALFGLAIGGLAIIVGMIVAPIHAAYITEEDLQQGVDAAAYAASAEFKRNYHMETMVTAAQNALIAHNIIAPDVFLVETCDSVAIENGLLPVVDHLPELIALDPIVCSDPLRKIVLVRVVTAVEPDGLPTSIASVAEAASVDLVLVIDASESMSLGWSNEKTGDARDPSKCNTDDPAGGETASPAVASPSRMSKKGHTNSATRCISLTTAWLWSLSPKTPGWCCR